MQRFEIFFVYMKKETMKRAFSLLFCFIGSAVLFVSLNGCKKNKPAHPQEFYYYGFNEKIYLTPVPNQLIVRFINESSDSLKAQVNRLEGVSSEDWIDSQTVIITTVDFKVQQTLLQQYEQDGNVVSAHPMYKTSSGAEVGLTDEFSVQFLDNVPLFKINQLNSTYHVTIVEKTDLDYLLRVAPKENALEIANKYYEIGLTKFSEPNFWEQLILF